MKSKEGYQLFRNDDGGYYPYYCKKYDVNGRNIEGNPEDDNFSTDEIASCRSMKEVLTEVRKHKNDYHHIDVWEEYIECEVDEYGWLNYGDVCRQVLHVYENGKRVFKDTLL